MVFKYELWFIPTELGVERFGWKKALLYTVYNPYEHHERFSEIAREDNRAGMASFGLYEVRTIPIMGAQFDGDWYHVRENSNCC